MKFIPTRIEGAYIVEAEPHRDERGTFCRTFDASEFAEYGLAGEVAQGSFATNVRRGTMRGMHWQVAPALETKYVRCVRGVVYDQIVDLRLESPTYLERVGVELSADNWRGLFVPALCAHGYQTLTDDTEVHYVMNEYYDPATQRGLRYDDSALGLEWPVEVTVISDKDSSWPPFTPDSPS